MILESSFGLYADNTELYQSSNFLGESCELSELTTSALSEMHNLTVAMARFEHRCITESSDSGLLEAGVREFFKKAVDTIKKWWNQFTAWLGSMWTRIKDVFVKRSDWLGRNKAAVLALTAENLKGLRVKIGQNVIDTDWSGTAVKVMNEAKEVVSYSSSPSQLGSDDRSMLTRAKEKLMSPFKNSDAAASVAKRINDELIGQENEVDAVPGLVKNCVTAAENSFKAIDQMKGAKMVAEAALKEAEGLQRMSGDDSKTMNGRIAFLRGIGPEVQSLISGYTAALNTANGQAMGVVVKAAARVSSKKPEVQNNSGDLLAAFMS